MSSPSPSKLRWGPRRIRRAVVARVRPLSDRWTEVFRRARAVRDSHGKAVASQLKDILLLGRGPGKLSPLEYFDMGLYDDSRYSMAAKYSFMGDRRNREIDVMLNHPQWRAVADSKIILSAMLQGLGLPCTTTYAVYRPGGRSVPHLPFLQTPDELVAYLRSEAPYPMFVKPTRSHYGEGAYRLEGIDREADQLIVGSRRDRQWIPDFAKLVDSFQNTAAYGYLFQQPIIQHPSISQLTGNTVSTMRMVVALDRQGPRLLRVMFRVARIQATTDNLVGGTSGNIAAAVDINTGTVVRALVRNDMQENVVTRHPDTDLPVEGFQIPFWNSCVSTVFDAASLLPGLRLQHWDVAVGPNGPILVEVNYAGGAVMSQIIHQKGALTPELLRLVSEER